MMGEVKPTHWQIDNMIEWFKQSEWRYFEQALNQSFFECRLNDAVNEEWLSTGTHRGLHVKVFPAWKEALRLALDSIGIREQ